MRRNLGMFGGGLKAAHSHPDETIQVGDRQIRCLVVGFGMQDYARSAPNPEILPYDEKVWIDNPPMLIDRTELTEERRTFGTIGKGVVSHSVVAVDSPVVSLDEPIPDDAF